MLYKSCYASCETDDLCDITVWSAQQLYSKSPPGKTGSELIG